MTNNLRRNVDLDDVDRTLLRLLQENARMTNARMAELAGIAPSTCVARIRSLVDRGVITGFAASIDPVAVGLGLEALISVNIRAGARARIAEFSAGIRRLPEVVQVFFLGGSEDFVIHLAARDSAHVRDFVVEHLSADPTVASTRTSLVFEHAFIGVEVGE
ncbi:AsnC family transcriptional regulator [Plantibacter sp. Leaf171]|uniref:Lrp/AsnC family transcriptional regulator n=1 Tax=unclassified Plantibacter TaxID=2624265 RepID=UPI0006F6121E|nr:MULTISPECIES: Lrp/AsnC family transcriptional regulator [unclassified Plantibacter]KQM15547.1 AsnC family transcriptional regulator [Plantibacter sp. Leaf1]KQQ51640.1 AsnC family transcriptional regulator [Plantibacter sp. Leaf314]KQR58691.1 AsnC family transcriptional regulator [Plantibacter sp. Leaf171]